MNSTPKFKAINSGIHNATRWMSISDEAIHCHFSRIAFTRTFAVSCDIFFFEMITWLTKYFDWNGLSALIFRNHAGIWRKKSAIFAKILQTHFDEGSDEKRGNTNGLHSSKEDETRIENERIELNTRVTSKKKEQTANVRRFCAPFI